MAATLYLKKILLTSFAFSLIAGFTSPIAVNAAELKIENTSTEEYSNPAKISSEDPVFNTANIEYIQADGNNIVKATSNLPATPEQPLRIYNENNKLLAETTAGNSIEFTIPRSIVSYYSTFGESKSEPITPFTQENIWSLNLSSDKEIFNHGDMVRLTLDLSKPDDTSGYASYILNSKDEVVGYRGLFSGATYDVYPTGDSEEYRLVIARSMSDWSYKTIKDLIDIKSESNIVTVVKNQLQIGIKFDRTEILANEKAILEYTLNYPMPYRYLIYIADTKTGEIVATRSASYDGSVDISFASGDPKTYQAYVAREVSYAYNISDLKEIVASSNTAELKRTPWTVSVVTESPTFKVGEKGILKWETNQPHSTNDYYPHYALYLYDKTEGVIIDYKTPSADGTFETTFYTGGPHEYEIYVARKMTTYDWPNLEDLQEVQAVSNTVTLQRAPWSVSLESDLKTFRIDDRVNFTITAEQYNSYNYNSYHPYLIDTSTGNIISWTYRGIKTGFDATELFYTGDPRTYKVVIAYPSPKDPNQYGLHHLDDLSDIQAESNPITLTRAPWTVTPVVHSWVEDEAWYQQPIYKNNVSYETNQPRTYSPFRGGLYNITNKEWVEYSTRNGANTALVYSDPAKSQEFQWIYGEPTDDPQNPIGVIEARSAVFTLAKPGGPTDKHETAGGSNPSENCVQSCVGDPINTATGEFWENNNDLIIPQNGPMLGFARSFATSKKDEHHGLGKGWTHNYNIFLKYFDAEGNNTDLENADSIVVVQENGSEVTFTRKSNGEFESPARVKANIELKEDGTISFTRKNQNTFIFSSLGKLTKIKDRNDNFILISYDSNGKIFKVSNDKNQFINIEWKNSNISSVSDHAGRSVSYGYNENNNLVNITNVLGDKRSYEYDEYNRVISLENELGGLTKNVYIGDNDDRIASQTDPLGNTMEFSYSGSSTTISYPNGKTLFESYNKQKQLVSRAEFDGREYIQYSYKYTIDNQIAQVINSMGHSTYVSYDQDGNPINVQRADGYVTSMTYNELGNILTITDPMGNVTKNTYDERGNPLSSTSPEGRTQSYTVNTDGTINTSVSEQGNVEGVSESDYTSSYDYNASGYLASIIDVQGNISTMETDSLGRITKTVNPLGNTPGADIDEYAYTFSYDKAGNLLSSVQPNGALTKTSYDAMGNALTTEDALGNISSYVYDKMGNLTSSKNALGHTTSFSYDSMHQLVKITDSKGKTSEIVYDKFGRVIKTIDSLGSETSNTWNVLNQLISSTDKEGKTTSYTYNVNGFIVKAVDSMGNVSTIGYNANNQITFMTDAENRTTYISYTPDGFVNETTRPDGSKTSSIYNISGLLESAKDAAGNIKSWEYDTLDQQKKFVDEMQRSEEIFYNASGQIVSEIKTDGSVIDYEYDSVGNLVKVDYPNSDMDITYAYDLNGMRISEQKGNGEIIEYSYNTLGQLKARGPPGSQVEYSYDESGNQTSIKYPSGRVVNYDYDANDNITAVKTDSINQAVFEYDKRGLSTKAILPTGVETISSYDDMGRLSSLNLKASTDINLYNKSYQYTPAGNVSTQSVGVDVPELEDFSYDPLSRLVSGSKDSDGVSPTYEYDIVGNLTKNIDNTQSYDASGQIQSSGSTVFSYDARGNRIQSTDSSSELNNKTYTWDENNLLTGFAGQSQDINYTYDSSGLLSSRSSSGIETNSFIWDMNASIPLLLDDGENEYIYGIHRTPLAQINKSTGEVTYLHADMIGSVVATSDESGELLGKTSYTPYGVNRGEKLSSFGFAGEWTDPETGLSYLRARWLDTSTGTFLSVDPLIQLTGEAYGYTAGNPLNRIDPLGLAFLGGSAFSFMDSPGFQGFTNFVSGFGDSVSMGGTSVIRNLMGTNAVVDTCSSFYTVGGATGTAASLILPGGAGVIGAKSLKSNTPRTLDQILDRLNAPITMHSGVPNNLPNMVYSREKMPVISKNIEDGIKNGHPSILTRLNPTDDKKLIKSQRAKATWPLRSQAKKDPTTKPANHSIDEYPFASTAEGGKGSQTVWAPVSEQQAQSALIRNFNRQNKIQPGDKYNVVVEP